MTKPISGAVLIFLIFVIAAMGAAALRPGVLMIGQHEGDALHLLEIVLRMSNGETPHIDFMTPLGAFGFAPIAWFVQVGFGVGQATLWAQIVVAALVLPAVWWVAVSRFSGIWPYVFGLVVLSLVLAVVYGDAIRALTISMHYNRWAWAVSFIVVACTILRPVHRQSAVLDGLVVGALMSFLALAKLRYYVAFLPDVAVALLARRQWRTIAIVCAVGLISVVLMTLLYGTAYWAAYVGDLLTVAQSKVRPYPGDPFVAVLGAPAYIGGSLLLLGAIMLLRQAEMAVEGLVVLFLTPAFFYVTYQNFGNDPQWLVLLGLILFAARPSSDVVNGWGWNMRQAISRVGVAALALSMPSMANNLYSPFRHAATDTDGFTPVLATSERHDDLLMRQGRYYKVNKSIPYSDMGAAFDRYEKIADRPELPAFAGDTVEACEIDLGIVGVLQAIADDLEEAGYGGAAIMNVDVFSSLWLFGDFQPLPDGAPWYYGGLPGIDGASHVLLPDCPIAANVHRKIVETFAASDVTLVEVRRAPLYTLYRKDGD